jgi:UDP-N-acetylglucosamine 2-epimerase (non-hydrolysing)
MIPFPKRSTVASRRIFRISISLPPKCRGRTYVTGNTVIDSLLLTQARLTEQPDLAADPIGPTNGSRIIVVTAHRRESFGLPFRRICEAVRAIAESRRDVMVVYPVHLNPNVRAPVREILGGLPNVRLLEPLDYVSFVACMQRAYILLTDSGGIQEEGPALRKPVLVMREVSERPEAIAAGTACLTGTDPDAIVGTVSSLLDDPARYQRMTSRPNPYGDGHAAERIIQFLINRVMGSQFEGRTSAVEREAADRGLTTGSGLTGTRPR